MKLSERMNRPAPIACCDFPACRGACCAYGVWVGEGEIAKIMENAEAVRRFLPPEAEDPAGWFTDETEPDPHLPCGKVRHTRVLTRPEHPLGSACVFWVPPDGYCALQLASEALGKHPWALKPFYCVLHPLDIEEDGTITIDDVQELTSTKGGCVKPSEAARPPKEIFGAEIEWVSKVLKTTDCTD